MERFLGMHFLDHLSFSNCFGESQFAYRKYHGSRDAVLFVILTWLRALALGRKIGIYCSDVSSAFDRVSSLILKRKMDCSVIHPDLVRVISEWLVGRIGEVIVQGSTSHAVRLSDMTFQGTVWGPALWNLFFSNAPLAVRRCGFKEVIFADDLNAFREFANNISNDFILTQLKRCQFELHEWGAANSITFDEKKESFHVVSRTDSMGESFRLLGIIFDLQLTMEGAISECSIQAHWRLSSILRSKRFFSLKDLMLLYKAHVLSYLEYRTCAITHAADSHLNALDVIQNRLLRNLELRRFDALHQFNLAPLGVRRDIANLGIIYRAISRRGPRKLRDFFQLNRISRRSSPRFPLHSYQVLDNTRELHRDYLDRSTFGYIGIFNLLPAVVFVSPEYEGFIPINEFQSNLNKLVKLASHVDNQWANLYSPRFELSHHLVRDFHDVDLHHLQAV
jgi:hypothetical protein